MCTCIPYILYLLCRSLSLALFPSLFHSDISFARLSFLYGCLFLICDCCRLCSYVYLQCEYVCHLFISPLLSPKSIPFLLFFISCGRRSWMVEAGIAYNPGSGGPVDTNCNRCWALSCHSCRQPNFSYSSPSVGELQRMLTQSIILDMFIHKHAPLRSCEWLLHYWISMHVAYW